MSNRATPIQLRRKAGFQALAVLCVIPLCIYAAQPFLTALNWQDIRLAWTDITVLQWSAALLSAAGSFCAIGQYDVIVHRHLETRVCDRDARQSGAAAVALSQTLGLGLITGSLARWRAVASLSLVQASAITALVSLSFLWAWLTLFGLAGLIFPDALPLPSFVFLASLFSSICFLLFAVLRRHVTVLKTRVRLPGLNAAFALVLFATVDTVLAAFAFWLLLPGELHIPLAQFFPIYLACLGIALTSNTPGGVGPFEVTLLWAMSGSDVNGVLAGLIAFRMVYFAVPACIAMLHLARPSTTPLESGHPPSLADMVHLHPESAVCLQSGRLLRSETGDAIAALGRTGQASVAMFEPAANFNTTYRALRRESRKHLSIPLLYKCSARCARDARAQGKAVARISKDAILDLAGLDLETPKRRGLRRKIRKANKAGIDCRALEPTPSDWRCMEQIDRIWQMAHGRARGFSMGRFDIGYLQHQQLFAAYQDGVLVAFVSCHAAKAGWALDLMRHGTDLPDGTMHALVWHAALAARHEGAGTFSLASVPCRAAPLLRLIERFGFNRAPSADGLVQFKSSFAPRWAPLYAVADTRGQLCLALWDLWQEVQDPPPLAPPLRTGAVERAP